MNSVIYFIRRESDGNIKIGTSTSLQQRIRELSYQHGELTLLGVISGGYVREKLLHWIFKGGRVDGEFFVPDLELRMIIDKYTEMPILVKKTSVRKKRDAWFNGEKLSKMIAESGMTQDCVAKRLGVHINTVNNWANGRMTPHPDRLINVLCIIGMTPDEIVNQRIGDWYTVEQETQS